MAHFKRGKFRKHFKGCRALCSYRSTNGTRRRLPTWQEKKSLFSEKEQKQEIR